jgi:hypothetical protein
MHAMAEPGRPTKSSKQAGDSQQTCPQKKTCTRARVIRCMTARVPHSTLFHFYLYVYSYGILGVQKSID